MSKRSPNRRTAEAARTKATRSSAADAPVFFFSSRRRHTRSLCDWSSDVCPSDLAGVHLELLRPGQRRAVDRGLRPAGAVGGAFEQVGADLLERELEQVRPEPVHGLPHVSRLAALARKEQGNLSVASHLYEPSRFRGVC